MAPWSPSWLPYLDSGRGGRRRCFCGFFFFFSFFSFSSRFWMNHCSVHVTFPLHWQKSKWRNWHTHSGILFSALSDFLSLQSRERFWWTFYTFLRMVLGLSPADEVLWSALVDSWDYLYPCFINSHPTWVCRWFATTPTRLTLWLLKGSAFK